MGKNVSKVLERVGSLRRPRKQEEDDDKRPLEERVAKVLSEHLANQDLSRVLLPWVLQSLKQESEGGEPEAEPSTSAQAAPDATGDKDDDGPKPKPLDDHTLTKVSSVEELIAEVNKAREEKITLRVAGSIHSVTDAVYPDSSNGKTLRLYDDLRKIVLLREEVEEGEKVAYFKVGGGCYLGRSPMDWTSTEEDSVCYQVNEKGYAFPDLGGITRQSVGGFIMTGSAGGSLQHSFSDCIEAIEFVNGLGELQVAETDSDLWKAVGVSMGLFGIITNVTFRLKQKYRVGGTEASFEFTDSGLDKSKVEETLKTTEFYRANWFPEKYLGRVTEWKTHKTEMAEIKPYHHPLQRPIVAVGASVVLSICNSIQQKEKPTEMDYKLMALLLKPFVPLDKTQEFCDVWYKVLPTDNQAPVDGLMKVDFTEIWIPIEQSSDVIETLQKMFEDDPRTAGSFAVEVYGAKRSPFWMSMSHEVDVIRIDVYWWHYNKGDIREYFSYYWDALLKYDGVRLHWGKWLPKPGQKCGDVVFDKEWMRKAYPKYDDWIKLRQENDPDQVFVSSYWRAILDIPTTADA